MRVTDKPQKNSKNTARAPSLVNAALGVVPKTARQDTAKTLKGLSAADLSPDMLSAVKRLIGEVDRLNADAESLQLRIGELEALADTDPLVPAYNRRAFTRELNRAMAMARRHKLAGGLVLIDLDDFKMINDTYGHPAGDMVLHGVAKVLREQVRETDIVGRLGGDEFGVLLAAADEAGAAAKAASLIEAIRAHDFFLDGLPMRIGASAGAQSFGDSKSAEELMKRADDALYECKKKKGRAV